MILVTGATGFVGRNLILSLSKKNDKIIGHFRREKKLDETKHFFIENNEENNFNKIIWRKANIFAKNFFIWTKKNFGTIVFSCF